MQSFLYLFDRQGLRWFISLILPVVGRLTKNGVQSLKYDDGWIHNFSNGIIVEPAPRLRNVHVSEPINKYIWGLLYSPKPGDTVVDIGAGLGSETFYYAASVGQLGRVLSIEAHPYIYKFLSKTITLNKFNWVQVVNTAVSDRKGFAFIEDDIHSHIGNSIVQDSDSSSLQVETITLDQLCDLYGLVQIDFLKVNIEGAERLAIAGMNSIIKRTKCVCISCHDFKYRETGNTFFATKSIVEDYLVSNGFILVPRYDGDREIADQVNAWNPLIVD